MISAMRQALQFDQPAKSSDETGGQEETYTNWFTCRGSMRKVSGYRAFQSGYDASVNVYECYIPWRHEVETNLSKDVIVNFEGRQFAIEHFHLVEENRQLIRIELKEIR